MLDKGLGKLVRFRRADKVLRKVYISFVQQWDAIQFFHRREEFPHLANVLDSGFSCIAHRVVVQEHFLDFGLDDALQVVEGTDLI